MMIYGYAYHDGQRVFGIGRTKEFAFLKIREDNPGLLTGSYITHVAASIIRDLDVSIEDALCVFANITIGDVIYLNVICHRDEAPDRTVETPAWNGT